MDALADAGGQQVLSPYHAMACNPALMVDPFGLQSGKSDPRPPGSLLTGGNVPGSSGWGAITGYYKSTLGSHPRPAELQGFLGVMAMMQILSGDAAGAASRMSPGGGSAMSSYEQQVQIDGWQRQWRRYANNRSENQKNILDAFAQFVYSIDNGYDIFDDQGNVIRTVLDEQVVQGGLQSNGGESNWYDGLRSLYNKVLQTEFNMYDGIPVIKTPFVNPKSAFTPANFVISGMDVDYNSRTGKDLLRHEFGHVWTFYLMGGNLLNYSSLISIPSVISHKADYENHHSFITERITNSISTFIYGPFSNTKHYPTLSQ